LLRLPVADLSPAETRGHYRASFCVGSVMGEMALGQVFPRVLTFAAVNIISPLGKRHFRSVTDLPKKTDRHSCCYNFVSFVHTRLPR
jgi:hypothetical protein